MFIRLTMIIWISLFGLVLVCEFAANPVRAQTSGGGGQLEALDNEILELWGEGKNNEALPLHKRVVELSDKTLGPEHPQIPRAGGIHGLCFVSCRTPDRG